jgi:hypothetical protein
MRRTKATLFPSGDGVGRMEPPGPPENVVISPLSRSSRWIE